MQVHDENGLLKEYRRRKLLYLDFSETVSKLLKTIITGVQLHSVTYRVKAEESLADKLRRPERNYQNLTDITDLAGVRITTYFHDHVDLVAKFVEDEFTIRPREFSGQKDITRS